MLWCYPGLYYPISKAVTYRGLKEYSISLYKPQRDPWTPGPGAPQDTLMQHW